VPVATAACASEAASDRHTAAVTPKKPIRLIVLRLAPQSTAVYQNMLYVMQS
jgi:hypothetical protein